MKIALALLLTLPAIAQQVPVKEVVLENGMKLLMVKRPGPQIAAGWIAKVGSVNERPGITGIAHLFEHMMFKGTQTIGTRNIEEDLKLNTQLDRVREQIRAEQRILDRKARMGEIEDPKAPAARSARHNELLKEFDDLTQKQRALIVQTEFDRIYTAQGATGANAGTSSDFTIYYIEVPANKLELWMWMESDRLYAPVFREFYAERDVVHEERRLRTDSTPTGRQREEFNALFWRSSPYGWPVIGWPSDLEAITREDANQFFAQYYAPNNVTAALVGDFDQTAAEALFRKYFGRIPRGLKEPEPVRTTEMPQLGSVRLESSAETNPEVRVRYHAVADGHADEPALHVLASLLNGRTGRLYKSLVLEKQVANNAFASASGQKYEGYFDLGAVAKPGRPVAEAEQALYAEIEKLQKEPPADRELQKVKNQLAADNFRGLQSNFGLMQQLLVADSYRGWQTIHTDPPRMQAVTATDVQRVAKKYFAPEGRNVLTLQPKPKGGSQ